MSTNKEMPYRSLGRCGTKVSVLGLGGWTTFGGSVKELKTVSQIVRAAFAAGVNFFDLADVYATGQCEEVMGAALKELPRHELVVSTKVFWPMSQDINDRGLSRKHIIESIDKSLRRMGTDYVDIYFCHRYDEETPLEETVRAMDDLVHQGKVLYWGTSEWTGPQLTDAHRIADHGHWYAPQVEQPQYSLLARRKLESSVRDTAVEKGMGLVIWSPLASGLLTGKYDAGVPQGSRLANMDWLREKLYQNEIIDRVKRMKRVSDHLGCTRSQLALAWAAKQKGISSVITGATHLEQLQENLGALKVTIDPATERELEEIFPVSASVD